MCRLPVLRPENALAWELFQALRRQLSFSWGADPLAVLELYRVPGAARPRLLRWLAALQGVARENEEKGRQG